MTFEQPEPSPEQPEGVSPEPEFIPGRPVLIKSGSSIRNGTIDTVDPGAGQARVRLEGGSVVPLPLSVLSTEPEAKPEPAPASETAPASEAETS